MRPLRHLPTILLAALLAHAAHAAAPDFTLPRADGTPLSLRDLRGQVVMINFWATWCGPCREEMPLLQQIQAKYEPMGFTLIGINVEPDPTAARAWLAKTPVSFPILLDAGNAVAAAYGVQGMPSSVFIDRAGNVRHVHRGYKPGDEAAYADLIRSLVKE